MESTPRMRMLTRISQLIGVGQRVPPEPVRLALDERRAVAPPSPSDRFLCNFTHLDQNRQSQESEGPPQSFAAASSGFVLIATRKLTINEQNTDDTWFLQECSKFPPRRLRAHRRTKCVASPVGHASSRTLQECNEFLLSRSI